MTREHIPVQRFDDNEFDDDPHVRALEEGAGYSHSDAEAKVFGAFQSDDTSSRPKGYSSPRKAQASRPTRSPRADGDNYLDPHWNPEYDHPSPEEAERRSHTSRRGLALATEMLKNARRDAIINDTSLTDSEKINKLADLQLQEKVRQQRRGEV